MNRIFLPGRKQSFQLLDLHPGERILLVGVGTGADLPLLPEGVEAVGVDLCPEMLARARRRLPLSGRRVNLLNGDAQHLLVDADAFDAVVFHLILSVIPDGRACLHENLRALKPDGRAVFFDKFAPEAGHLSFARRFLNGFSTLVGTDITRRIGELLQGSDYEIVRQEASILGGMYQAILIKHK